MKKWIIIIVFVAIGLMGCNGDSEDKITELEQQIEELQKEVSYVSEQNKIIDVEQPEINAQPVLNLVDPMTSKVVKTFLPLELGYATDFGEYVKEIEDMATELARGTSTSTGYDKRMVLDQIDEDGQIIKGNPMIILKESELVERILAASSTGGDVELPVYVTESGYQPEEVPDLDEVLLASYTTYFKTTQVGRNTNIELSAKTLHNVIVGSGDIFSFNTMVGPRTKDRGYQPAPEIISGEVVMGIGGGICQTSSTLFNAVDQLPIDIIERHHHSLNIGYVPEGRDATVAYGSLDFRFQNTSGVPFLIQTFYGNGSITVAIRTSKDNELLLEAIQ